MGFFKDFYNQTEKPEGKLGKWMIRLMNSGHKKMAKWGMSHLGGIAPEQIAELGCGGGLNIRALLKKYPGAKVNAIDYSPLSVEMATEYNKGAIKKDRCTVEKGDVSALELPKDSYDLATAFETIYFWPGLEECFSQVAGVLKDGGSFMIVNESDGCDKAGKKFEKIIDGMTCYTADDIINALRAAGFKRIEADHHHRKPWITVIAKK